MKIVKPSVKLIGLMMPVEAEPGGGEYLPIYDFESGLPEKLIELAGRVCYKSEDKITPSSYKQFIDKVCNKLHHESIIEHSCVSFSIVCDRGVSHELVRHRIASYSQESTRYCCYAKDKFGNEISVIEPPGLEGEAKLDWLRGVQEAEIAYFNMLKRPGITPQIARSVLPTCLKTEIIMTANFREWKHFIRLRTSPTAHPQMIEIATYIKNTLMWVAPTIFKDQ